MNRLLTTTAILSMTTFANISQAAAPLMYRCVDVTAKKAFQLEMPANGKGSLKFLKGFPVRSSDALPITGFASKGSFRYGSEVEGGMFRNGIFYYHNHNTGSGSKVVNATCRNI